MNDIKIIFDKDFGYTIAKSTDSKLFLLGHFLTTDVGDYAEGWIEWVLDDSSVEVSSNATFLEKIINNVLLRDMYDDDGFESSFYFKIGKGNLIKLLDIWDKLCKEKVIGITITQENDVITMTGTYANGQIKSFRI